MKHIYGLTTIGLALSITACGSAFSPVKYQTGNSGSSGSLSIRTQSVPDSAIQTMDVSTTLILPANKSAIVKTFPLSAGIGFIGLSGSIALDVDSTGVFGEELLEIGYAATCDNGTFKFSTEDEFAAHVPNAHALHAIIAKSNSSHNVLPIDYTLPSPVPVAGCFYVRSGADTWQVTGAAKPNFTATNSLIMRYVNASYNGSPLSMDEAEGATDEFCIGGCDPLFAGAQPVHGVTFKTVWPVTQSRQLVSLLGSVSNGPFSADGRFPKVTGAWSTDNIVYLEPQCRTSGGASSGKVPDSTEIPKGAIVLFSIHLSGTGPNSVAQQFINHPVNQAVQTGDCIVHLQWATANSVVDNEIQLAGVFAGATSGVVAVAETRGGVKRRAQDAAAAQAASAARGPAAISYGTIAAGAPVTCDQLNPDAIKALDTTTISWLASIQSTGITLAENYGVARDQGYTGAFGHGEHIAYLNADPAHLANFNAAVSVFANRPVPPWATVIAHHQARRAAGYQGVFVCGGDICFQAGQCDNLGRRL